MHPLVIISDLMQHTENLSFYHCDSICFKHADMVAKKRLSDQYSSIIVYFIDRESISQNKKELAISFWKKYLKQMTSRFIFKSLLTVENRL